MSLLDDYNQSMDDDAQAADPVDISKKRADLERSIIIADSDLKKLLRGKEALEIDLRKLKKEELRIRVERDALTEQLKKIENEQRLLEEELKGLRKKLKVLH